MKGKKSLDVSTAGMYILVALRIIIGWHFLYEGLVKLGDPAWTAAGYLEQSRYILPGLFHWIANSPGMLAVVDFINIWGQILIGLGLMLGLFTRTSAITGTALLALYYLANPPFVTASYGSGLEGHYLFVDKNLIEAITLLVISFFPTGLYLGLDKIIQEFVFRKREARKIVTPDQLDKEKSEEEQEPVKQPVMQRREILKHLATLPVLGAFGLAYLKKKKWESIEEQNLVDIMSGASVVRMDFPELDELKGELPMAQIKDKTFSKVILGGNLLNGWAHSRDLIYVSHLVRAYHTKERIFRTLVMAEKCGINTLLSHPIIAKIINEYWDKKLGKIQFISDCAGLEYTDGVRAMPFQDWLDLIQEAIDNGATSCYIQGETADYYFAIEGYDKVAKGMQLIRDAGLPVGIGAHNIETIKKAVELGFEPDYWMKTIHHQNYWSAQHPTWHDNKYCFNTEETIAFMNDLPQPWIGFKILAAGAIHPDEAFKFAFKSGADIICVGMYDFQIVQDVNIALDCLNDPDVQNRKRPWRA